MIRNPGEVVEGFQCARAELDSGITRKVHRHTGTQQNRQIERMGICVRKAGRYRKKR